MDTEVCIPVPKRELAEFCKQNQIGSLALCGSVPRVDFRADSDVDVVAELESGADVRLMEFGRMQLELGAVLNREVDLVPKNGLRPRIRDSVLASSEARCRVPQIAEQVAQILRNDFGEALSDT